MQTTGHESNGQTDRKPDCGSICAYFHARWVEPPGTAQTGREVARIGEQTKEAKDGDGTQRQG